MGLESESGDPSAELLAKVEAAARLDRADPAEIIDWAVKRFHGNVAVAASFQDAVLVDLAVGVDPSIEVIFLDTEYHFPETHVCGAPFAVATTSTSSSRILRWHLTSSRAVRAAAVSFARWRRLPRRSTATTRGSRA